MFEIDEQSVEARVSSEIHDFRRRDEFDTEGLVLNQHSSPRASKDFARQIYLAYLPLLIQLD